MVGAKLIIAFILTLKVVLNARKVLWLVFEVASNLKERCV